MRLRVVSRQLPFPVLPPPAHQQRSANIMTTSRFSHATATAKTLFNNANLLGIRPAPTATGIGDRKNLYFGSVSMVGHNVGPKPKSSVQKDGPRRRLAFDARFPINIDSPLDVLRPGQTTVHDALVALKVALPYTLRFELEMGAKGSHAFRKRPHPDLQVALLTIPAGPLSVGDAMRLIVAALPAGWQATYFVSHVILYKENRQYAHGVPI